MDVVPLVYLAIREGVRPHARARVSTAGVLLLLNVFVIWRPPVRVLLAAVSRVHAARPWPRVLFMLLSAARCAGSDTLTKLHVPVLFLAILTVAVVPACRTSAKLLWS